MMKRQHIMWALAALCVMLLIAAPVAAADPSGEETIADRREPRSGP